jgi:hypothetical protein
VKLGSRKAVTNAAVTPASYNGTVFTPPRLSGGFLTKKPGRHVQVNVSLSANLLGFGIGNAANAQLRVIR